MKHFFVCVIFALCTQAVFAAKVQTEVETEMKNYLYAHVVAYQPKAVGFPQFVNTLSNNSTGKQWHELIVASRAVKVWPLISLKDGQIHFKVEDQAYAVEIADLASSSIKINGRLFQFDPKKSYFQQAQTFIKQLEDKKTAFQFLIPNANAKTNEPASATIMVAPTIVGAVGGTVTAMTAAAFGSIGSAGAVGVVAIGAAAGAGAGAVLCTGVQLLQSGETFWDRYLNCVTAPLTAIGMNPRDQLRFQKFEKCSPNQIQVGVASSTGLYQIREFEFVEGKLQTVKVIEPRDENSNKPGQKTIVANFLASTAGDRLIEGQTVKGKRVTTELTRSQLEGLQGLVRDAELYKGVCADPSRKSKFESQASQAPRPSQMKPSKLHESGAQ